MPNIFRMEFRKMVFPAAQMQSSRLEIRSLFDMSRSVPTFPKITVLPVSGDSAGVRILYEDSDLCVADKPSGMSATLPTAIISIP